MIARRETMRKVVWFFLAVLLLATAIDLAADELELLINDPQSGDTQRIFKATKGIGESEDIRVLPALLGVLRGERGVVREYRVEALQHLRSSPLHTSPISMVLRSGAAEPP